MEYIDSEENSQVDESDDGTEGLQHHTEDEMSEVISDVGVVQLSESSRRDSSESLQDVASGIQLISSHTELGLDSSLDVSQVTKTEVSEVRKLDSTEVRETGQLADPEAKDRRQPAATEAAEGIETGAGRTSPLDATEGNQLQLREELGIIELAKNLGGGSQINRLRSLTGSHGQVKLFQDCRVEEIENIHIAIKCEITNNLTRYEIKSLSELVARTNEELLHENMARIGEMNTEWEKSHRNEIDQLHRHYKEEIRILELRLNESQDDVKLRLQQLELQHQRDIEELKQHQLTVVQRQDSSMTVNTYERMESSETLQQPCNETETSNKEIQAVPTIAHSATETESDLWTELRELNVKHDLEIQSILSVHAQEILTQETQIVQLKSSYETAAKELRESLQREISTLREQIAEQKQTIIDLQVSSRETMKESLNVEEEHEEQEQEEDTIALEEHPTQEYLAKYEKHLSEIDQNDENEEDLRDGEIEQLKQLVEEKDAEILKLKQQLTEEQHNLAQTMSENEDLIELQGEHEIKKEEISRLNYEITNITETHSRQMTVLDEELRALRIKIEGNMFLEAEQERLNALCEAKDRHFQEMMKELVEISDENVQMKTELETLKSELRAKESECAQLITSHAMELAVKKLSGEQEDPQTHQLDSDHTSQLEQTINEMKLQLNQALDEQNIKDLEYVKTIDKLKRRVEELRSSLAMSEKQFSVLQSENDHIQLEKNATQQSNERLQKLLSDGVRVCYFLEERISQQYVQTSSTSHLLQSYTGRGTTDRLSALWHHSLMSEEGNSSTLSVFTDEGLDESRPLSEVSSYTGHDLDIDNDDVVHEAFGRLQRAVEMMLDITQDADRLRAKDEQSMKELRRSSTQDEQNINQLTTQLEEIRREFLILTTVKTELETKLSHAVANDTETKNEFERLETQVRDLEQRNDQLQSELNRLQTTAAIIEDYKSRISILEEEIRTNELFIEEHRVEREGEKEEYQKELNKMSDLLSEQGKQESEQVQSVQEGLEQHNDKLLERVKELERHVETQDKAVVSLKQQVTELEVALNNATDEYNQALVDKANIEADLEWRRLQMEKLSSLHDSLQLELEEKCTIEFELSERVQTLEEEMAKVDNLNVELTRELNEKRSSLIEYGKLQAMNRDLEEQLSEALQELDSNQQVIKDLKQQLRVLQTRQEELNEDKEELQYQVDDQLKQISTLRSQVDGLKLSVDQSEEDAREIQHLRHLVDENKHTLDATENQNVRLTSELETLQQTVRSMEDDLHEMNAQLEAAKNDLEVEQVELSRVLKVMQEKEEIIIQLRTKLQTVEMKLDSSNQSRLQNQDQHSEAKKKLEEDMQTKDSVLEELMSQLATSQAQTEQQNAQFMTSRAALEREMTALRQDLDKSKHDFSTLQEQLGEKDKIINQLQKEMQGKDEEISSLKAAVITELENKLATLQKEFEENKNKLVFELNEKTDEMLLLRSQSYSKKNESEVIQGQLQQSKDEYNALKAQFEEREYQLKTCSTRLNNKEQELKSVEDELKVKIIEHTSLEQQLEDESKLVMNLKQQLELKETELMTLRSKLDEMTITMSHLEKNSHEHKTTADIHSQHMDDLRDSLKNEYENKIMELKQKHAEDLAALTASLGRHDDCDQEIGILKERLMKSEGQLEELLSQQMETVCPVHNLHTVSENQNVGQDTELKHLVEAEREEHAIELSKLREELQKQLQKAEKNYSDELERIQTSYQVSSKEELVKLELFWKRKFEEERNILVSELEQVRHTPNTSTSVPDSQQKVSSSSDDVDASRGTVIPESKFDTLANLQVILEKLHKESVEILSLSELRLLYGLVQNVRDDSKMQLAWENERCCLLEEIDALKNLMSEAAAKEKNTDAGLCWMDWRADLLKAVYRLFVTEDKALGAQIKYDTLSYQTMASNEILPWLENIIKDQEWRHTTSLQQLLTADRQSMLTEICDLRRQIGDLQTDLLDENNRLKEKIKVMEDEFSKKESRLKKHIARAEEKLKNERALSKSLRTVIDEDKKNMLELTIQLDKERRNMPEMNLKREVIELRSKVRQLEDALDLEKSHLVTSSIALEEERRKTVVLTELNTQDQIASNEYIGQLETEQIHGLKHRSDTSTLLVKLKSELELVKIELKDARLELEFERSLNAALRKETENAKDVMYDMEAVHRRQIAQLESTVNMERSRCDELTTALQRECKKTSEQRVLVEAEHSKYAALRSLLDSTKTELQCRLKDELNNANQLQTQLRQSQNNANQQLIDDANHRQTQTEITYLQKQNDDLKSQLESERLANSTLRKELTQRHQTMGSDALGALYKKTLIHLWQQQQLLVIKHQEELSRCLSVGDHTASLETSSELRLLRESLNQLLKQLANLYDQLMTNDSEDTRVVSEFVPALNESLLRENTELTLFSSRLMKNKQQLLDNIDDLESVIADTKVKTDASNMTIERLSLNIERCDSFRKALVYQKKYLLLLLGGFQDGEEQTLRMISQLGAYPSSTDTQRSRRHLNEALTLFRTAARVIIAALRITRTVRRWQVPFSYYPETTKYQYTDYDLKASHHRHTSLASKTSSNGNDVLHEDIHEYDNATFGYSSSIPRLHFTPVSRYRALSPTTSFRATSRDRTELARTYAESWNRTNRSTDYTGCRSPRESRLLRRPASVTDITRSLYCKDDYYLY